MIPKIDQIDDESRKVILPLLPRVAVEIVGLIGLEASLVLFVQFGGVVWRFTRGKAKFGLAARRFDEMVEVVGRENALRLADAFGHDDVYIPTCSVARRALRHRSMVAEFDELTQTVSAREAVNRIAHRYNMSTRSIECAISGKAKSKQERPKGEGQ